MSRWACGLCISHYIYFIFILFDYQLWFEEIQHYCSYVYRDWILDDTNTVTTLSIHPRPLKILHSDRLQDADYGRKQFKFAPTLPAATLKRCFFKRILIFMLLLGIEPFYTVVLLFLLVKNLLFPPQLYMSAILKSCGWHVWYSCDSRVLVMCFVFVFVLSLFFFFVPVIGCALSWRTVPAILKGIQGHFWSPDDLCYRKDLLTPPNWACTFSFFVFLS